MNYSANRTLVANITSDDTIFASLSESAAHDASFDSSRWGPPQKRECLKGTRKSVLEQIEGALKGSKSMMIWLSGSSGTGKSAIAYTVARRLKDLEPSRLAGSFFFRRKHKDISGQCKYEDTPGQIGLDFFVPTLAYQIAKSHYMAKYSVVNAIRSDPVILDPRQSLVEQFRHLIVKPLQNLLVSWRGLEPDLKVLVIDAVDICEGRIPELISCLSDLLRVHEPPIPNMHILITGRPLPAIDDAFETIGCDEFIHRIALDDVDVAEVREDICLLFTRALEKSYREYDIEHLKPEVEDETIRCLADRANGSFGAALAMITFLDADTDDGDGAPCNFEEKLEIMKNPGDAYLDSLQVSRFYKFIINSSENPLRAYRHLSMVVNLADSLTFPELRKLFGSLESDLLSILSSLSPIVSVPADDSRVVEVLHKETLREFLSPHLSDASQLLARSSLRMMRDAFVHRSNFESVLQQMMTQIPVALDPPQPVDALIDFLESYLEKPCSEVPFVTTRYPSVQLGPGTCCSTPSHVQHCISKDILALQDFQAKAKFHNEQVFELLRKLRAQPETSFIVILWAIRHAHFLASGNINSTNGSSKPHKLVELEAFMRCVREGGEQSLHTSAALKHACQHWSLYLSKTPTVMDGPLRTFLLAFWKNKLLSWFERQWYLEGLESCIATLHVVQAIDFYD